jgi:type II secretory pathway pseudopilin PulG
MTRPRGDRGGERGQILVLFTIVLVVIMGFTALVIDLGLLRNNRQTLANAMDAGALAGGTLLPVDGSQPGAATEIEALIDKTVGNTYPGLSTYDVKYLCLIGIGAGDPNAFDAADVEAFIPLDCDPRPSLGMTDPQLPDPSQFKGAGRTRIIDCDPEAGDRCNIVVVDGNVTTGFSFGRVVGVDSGNTGVVTSSACRGLCGELPADDFDVMLTVDTSGSMVSNRSAGETRLFWAKKAANELLDSLAASQGDHQVGLVRYSGNATDPLVAEILSPLGTDFPTIRTEIAGLTGAGNTPLKQGMAKGREALLADARARAIKVHIILSDGRPWPDNSTTRPNAAEVDAFKDSADQVYSVVIGEGGAPGTSSAVDPVLMRSLAKPDDDDHYLRVIDSSQLPDVFRQIAVNILNPRSHLIRPYPAPIVSSVGGGPTVSIGGKYFTGATRVTFGGAQVNFTVNSDTSITADAPNDTPGKVVHVQVTTPGGSSPRTSADQYTFP